MAETLKVPIGGKGKVSQERAAFWGYCGRTAKGAMARAIKRRVPFDITPYDIDRLFVDQHWCCAISGIPLERPDGGRGPFTPSLDRIVPELGYVRGNIRIVCNLVNFAMNRWGEEPLRELIHALRDKGEFP